MSCDDYPTCKDTYASFNVYPRDFDPSEITNCLSLKPTYTTKKGDVERPRDRDDTYVIVSKLNFWSFSTKGKVLSKDVRRHIDWLLDHLTPKQSTIINLQKQACQMNISCYWVSKHGHGGPILSPSQMEKLARLNIEIHFDCYFPDSNEE